MGKIDSICKENSYFAQSGVNGAYGKLWDLALISSILNIVLTLIASPTLPRILFLDNPSWIDVGTFWPSVTYCGMPRGL